MKNNENSEFFENEKAVIKNTIEELLRSIDSLEDNKEKKQQNSGLL